MAQTEARAGFRLPWSSDRQATDAADGDGGSTADDSTDETTDWPSDEAPRVAGGPADTDRAVDVKPADKPARSAHGMPTPAGLPSSGRKPSRFLADLTKAMQAAAEDARSRALTQLQADAKTHIETIHGRSTTESATLRRNADDDVASVREWSKAEIARIRDETETRITRRKAELELEIQDHAGVIEREVDAVQKTVVVFEDEMAQFFGRLLGEEDPSRFAAMAESLPEPPVFGNSVAADDPADANADANADATATLLPAGPSGTGNAATAGRVPGTAIAGTGTRRTATPDDAALDREAAFAGTHTAAEAVADNELSVHGPAVTQTSPDDAATELVAEVTGVDEAHADTDPRVAALGLSPDYDAAEAEALAAAGSSDEEVPDIADAALATRLAGLVPVTNEATTAAASTTVVVVGLVSVASIASFKRHLGRVAGVQSVGVSSGPDGEFVFAVTHGPDVVVGDSIPSMPGFQARLTGSTDGVVQVTAHDPESAA
ncbi:MAG: hypothetical protein NVS9B8_11280 [Candidatus Limnocylindrales bacterium]